MAENIIQKIFEPSARGKVWRTFIIIVLIVLVTGLISGGSYYNKAAQKVEDAANLPFDIPKVKEVPFKLGLDLLGGTHLVYTADVSGVESGDKASALEGVRDVIERRVNVFGVSEPLVQTNISGNDYRIIVELAGVKDVKEAIKMIGETPLLEFKEQSNEARELTDEERQAMEEFNNSARQKASEVLDKIENGEDFAALAREYSQDEDTKETGGELGWVTESENPNIISVVRDLEPGETTDDFMVAGNGYEIFKLNDKRLRTNPFDENEVEKEVKAAHILICHNDNEGCESGLSNEEARQKAKDLLEQATPENFNQLARENSTEPGAEQSGGELGWFSRGDMVAPFETAVFQEPVGIIPYIVESQFGYHVIYKEDERTITEYDVSHIFIPTMTEQDIIGDQLNWENTELTGKYLQRARVSFNPNDNTPEVSLEFDSEGADLFADITERNIGQPVAIFLDGSPISIPNVNEKITGGRAVISGNFNINEAKLLAQRLNAGALPVPIEIVNQQTVGATLGHQSLTDSLRAGIIGLMLVALFMILYYRLPGLFSVLSLLVYGSIILAIFKLWPVTLTLSGMAGLILSIGMAVDANVLIFERLKEELSSGKPGGMAIRDAFERAWPSIWDGSMSTLITCIVLYIFTTSVVRGFAVTLGFGVLISMFSAYFVTRNFLQLFISDKISKNNWLLGYKSSINK